MAVISSSKRFSMIYVRRGSFLNKTVFVPLLCVHCQCMVNVSIHSDCVLSTFPVLSVFVRVS